MDTTAQLNNALAGRYEVERLIGAGGMATVYLARDVRHERNVALKVLKPELGAILGVERFLTEIRVTANLQHPNLLPLFDSGEADGHLFYVMPFVDGETLRARLTREKQLPVDQALHIATSVASALDYAHRHGVIHRDLKPENILLHEGEPLVADFGIALAVSNAGGNRITQTGLSLGTPAYMSPEQATGDRAIDGRTDIYSLGAVLYEMLTGDPPYTGSTAQAIIARVLTEKPRSVRADRDSVPEHVAAAIERALSKLPADRWATAHDFAEALSGTRATAAPGVVMPRPEPRVSFVIPLNAMRRALPWTVAVVGLGAGALMASSRFRSAPPRTPYRFELVFGDSAKLDESHPGPTVALSPDGQLLAYSGTNGRVSMLYLRAMGDVVPRPLRGTEGASRPQFSPDGKWISFNFAGGVKKIAVDGGPVVNVAQPGGTYAWVDDDRLVFQAQGALWLVPATGGTPSLVARPDSAHNEVFLWPADIPGRDAVLTDISTGNIASAEIAVITLGDHVVHRLGIIGTNPRYLPGGYILAGRLDGAVFVVPFDARRLRVTGAAVPVLDNVSMKSGGAVELSVAASGSLVYVNGSAGRTVMLVDRNGKARPLLSELRYYFSPRLSPDGRRVALSMWSQNQPDVWVYDTASKTLGRVTHDGHSEAPVWMPDGKRVAFVRYTTGYAIAAQLWDGSGAADTLAKGMPMVRAFSVAPDGKTIAYSELRTPYDLYTIAADGHSAPQPLVTSPSIERSPRISPDGKWLAYRSDETGTDEIYVRPFPGPGGRIQVSAGGGQDPVWGADSRTIYYRGIGRVVVAAVSTNPPGVVRRDTLFSLLSYPPDDRGSYDVSRDGKTFVMISESVQAARVMLVLNGVPDIQQRLATAAGH